jgi:hypothetical protein
VGFVTVPPDMQIPFGQLFTVAGTGAGRLGAVVDSLAWLFESPELPACLVIGLCVVSSAGSGREGLGSGVIGGGPTCAVGSGNAGVVVIDSKGASEDLPIMNSPIAIHKNTAPAKTVTLGLRLPHSV